VASAPDLRWFSDDPSWLLDKRKRARLSLHAQEGLFLAARIVQSGMSVEPLAAELERGRWSGVKRVPLTWEDLSESRLEAERLQADFGPYHRVSADRSEPEPERVRWYPMKIYRRLARARAEIEQMTNGNLRTCRCGLDHIVPARTGRQGRPATYLDGACRQRAYRRRRKQGAKVQWHMVRRRCCE
jgi:hypothetical protein